MIAIDAQLSPQELLRQGVPEHPLLRPEVVQAVVAAAQSLFDGSLSDLEQDLSRRRQGRPYLFAAELAGVTSAEESAQVVASLIAYEQARGVSLSQVLQEDSR
ncbi:MAG: hypothetical protein EA402_05725 [Planctomycetota bacterium]|nr:MAG: hypothetical protein EA402_05725 [Planctomycetota bacterium]